jgi:hypothetical protein
MPVPDLERSMADENDDPARRRKRKDVPPAARPQPKAFDGEPLEPEEPVGAGSATGFVGMLARKQKETGERFTAEQRAALRAKYQVQMAREVILKKSKSSENKTPPDGASDGADAAADTSGKKSAETPADVPRIAPWILQLAALICFGDGVAALTWSIARAPQPWTFPATWLGAAAIVAGALCLRWGFAARRRPRA